MKFLTVTFLLLCLNFAAFSQTSSKTDNDSKKEAERLWELAIEAKGGREKLHAISNMAVSSKTEYYFELKKITNRIERFYVFPNKWWIWDDNRPSKFGLRMTMYNLESGKKYSIQEGQKKVSLESVESDYKSTKFSALITDLMETKWNQPIPEKLTSGKIRKQKVDVIQTSIVGQRIDFALNQKTHLPVKVIAYLNDKPSYSARVFDYVDIDGIKMPSKLILESESGNSEYNLSYQFNVEYNEEIFKSPPLPVETAAEVWRVKPKP